MKARPKKEQSPNVLRFPPQGHRRPAGHREEHDGLGNHRPCSEEPLRRSCRHHVRSIVLGHRGYQAPRRHQINCCQCHMHELGRGAMHAAAAPSSPARMRTRSCSRQNYGCDTCDMLVELGELRPSETAVEKFVRLRGSDESLRNLQIRGEKVVFKLVDLSFNCKSPWLPPPCHPHAIPMSPQIPSPGSPMLTHGIVTPILWET